MHLCFGLFRFAVTLSLADSVLQTLMGSFSSSRHCLWSSPYLCPCLSPPGRQALEKRGRVFFSLVFWVTLMWRVFPGMMRSHMQRTPTFFAPTFRGRKNLSF